MKNLSLLEIIEKIKSGEKTSKEVFEYFLKRIEKYDKDLNAFTYINKEGFKENNSSTLAGAPIGVKDIFAEKGIPTTGASKMLENFVPPYDATLVKKLNEAGMSSIGKLNMDEFAMGSSGENSHFGPTKNPWGTARIPGGSSSGSAAAVAAGLVPAALGTDTGGSLRQPASQCGVVGFRPSYGRNSRYGVFPMASSLDCPGTITRNVRDAGFLYEIMNGYDELENTSIKGKDIIDPSIWELNDLKGVKIGVPKEYFEEGLDAGPRKAIEEAIEKLKSLGAEIKEISLPMTKYAIAAYYIIVPAEVSTNLARLDGIRYGYSSDKPYDNMEDLYLNNRGEGLGNEAQRRTVLGSYVLSAGFYDAYFKKASQVRTLIVEDFKKAFEEVDVIVSPVSPSVAWKIGEKIDDPIKMYLEDAYTIPASLAGLPGMSVPCGFAESEDKVNTEGRESPLGDEEKEKLPVGLQIIGPQFGEQKIFKIANVYEKNTSWHKEFPAGFED